MRQLHLIILLLFILWPAACQNEDNEALPTRATPPVSQAVEPSASAEAGQGGEAAATLIPPPVPSATPSPPTPTPLPTKTVTVCLSAEPENLYLYGDASPAATAVRHALYENLYTTLDYAYQAQGLRKLPSLAEGDAVVQAVTVAEGDPIINPAGNVVLLLPGTQYINAEGEFEIFERPSADDPPVQMQQMVVDFAFQPLVWSDGTPVTAADSVFSYHLAADPATPGDKSKIERTSRYEAVDEQTVRWVGLPGYLDVTYFTNVWSPLPRHQLQGMAPEALLAAAETGRTPLASGPFVVSEWQPGRLTLGRNPHYYRLDEGYPLLDEVVFRFDADLSDPVTAVTGGDCDLITRNDLRLSQIPALQAAEGVQAYFVPTTIFEHLDFGVNSWDYGDDLFDGRPDWFEFLPVRQAVAQCINRQRLVDELLFGQSQVMDAYIPAAHPLFPADATRWAYDPAAANAALDEFGLIDTNGDGFRELVERNLQQTIIATTTFSITLGANGESPLRLGANALIQADLTQCGIRVNAYEVPAETWFDDGPFSPLFGRRFDLATYATITGVNPPCGLYLSTNVTGPEEQGFGGWGNINATGWSNEAYDEACQAALDALPGSEAYETGHQTAVRLFTERLPSVPLFQYPATAVAEPALRRFLPNATQPAETWNVFEWDTDD